MSYSIINNFRLKMNKKYLLVFAHTGEANSFIDFYKMKAYPFFAGKAYECEQFYLLISHEGIHKTTERLSAFLALNINNISKIINLGIAASLEEKFKKNEIYSIRTIYRELNNEMQFASFTSEDLHAQTDMLSSNQRVLSDEKASYLKCFAPTIDRELWAIASLAKFYKLQFLSYKMMSDQQGKNLENNSPDLCQMIKDQSNYYSDKLLQFFNEKHKPSVLKRIEVINIDYKLPNNEHLHFTLSGRRNYKNLIDALKIKLRTPNEEKIIEKIDLSNIIESHSNKKKRTALVIQELQDLLNPFQKQVKNKLKGLTEPLSNIGCDIKFSQTLENDNLNLAITIKNKISLDKYIKELNNLPYNEISDLLNGRTDV